MVVMSLLRSDITTHNTKLFKDVQPVRTGSYSKVCGGRRGYRGVGLISTKDI